LTRRDSSEMQLEHVFEQFRNSEIPTILMADLNVDETNEALQAFLNEPGVTDAVAQAIGPFWRLDWIVTKGFEVVQGDFTPRGISDHAHYWVELVFSSESLE
jgi:endonuclease/exonuclease/phosphatase family metal-dependent hydrolase